MAHTMEAGASNPSNSSEHYRAARGVLAAAVVAFSGLIYVGLRLPLAGAQRDSVVAGCVAAIAQQRSGLPCGFSSADWTMNVILISLSLYATFSLMEWVLVTDGHRIGWLAPLVALVLPLLVLNYPAAIRYKAFPSVPLNVPGFSVDGVWSSNVLAAAVLLGLLGIPGVVLTLLLPTRKHLGRSKRHITPADVTAVLICAAVAWVGVVAFRPVELVWESVPGLLLQLPAFFVFGVVLGLSRRFWPWMVVALSLCATLAIPVAVASFQIGHPTILPVIGVIPMTWVGLLGSSWQVVSRRISGTNGSGDDFSIRKLLMRNRVPNLVAAAVLIAACVILLVGGEG